MEELKVKRMEELKVKRMEAGEWLTKKVEGEGRRGRLKLRLEVRVKRYLTGVGGDRGMGWRHHNICSLTTDCYYELSCRLQ
ncbi:hypothetical protein LSAT2_007525 [Lamellibrachia satsuma]|nr:hypothetical protein LSAT2_007525 [Lamellibrachia satsuma]